MCISCFRSKSVELVQYLLFKACTCMSTIQQFDSNQQLRGADAHNEKMSSVDPIPCATCAKNTFWMCGVCDVMSFWDTQRVNWDMQGSIHWDMQAFLNTKSARSSQHPNLNSNTGVNQWHERTLNMPISLKQQDTLLSITNVRFQEWLSHDVALKLAR